MEPLERTRSSPLASHGRTSGSANSPRLTRSPIGRIWLPSGSNLSRMACYCSVCSVLSLENPRPFIMLCVEAVVASIASEVLMWIDDRRQTFWGEICRVEEEPRPLFPIFLAGCRSSFLFSCVRGCKVTKKMLRGVHSEMVNLYLHDFTMRCELIYAQPHSIFDFFGLAVFFPLFCV